jgi:hypothetical protein
MEKKGLIILFVIGMMFVSGCQASVVCETPYMRHGSECCLDQNDNKICDNDEESITIKQGSDDENVIASEDDASDEVIEPEMPEESDGNSSVITGESVKEVKKSKKVLVVEVNMCDDDDNTKEIGYLPLNSKIKMCQGDRISFGEMSILVKTISSSAVTFNIINEEYGAQKFDEKEEFETADGDIEMMFEDLKGKVNMHVKRLTNPNGYDDAE